MFEHILVAHDGSDGSKIAFSSAAELAKRLGARLTGIWVKSKLPHYPETVSEINEEKEGAEDFLRNLKKDVEEYEHRYGIAIAFSAVAGNPAKIIVEYAKENKCDLIVLGNEGHSGIWGVSLGHTADRVSEHAHCSVLIVRDKK